MQPFWKGSLNFVYFHAYVIHETMHIIVFFMNDQSATNTCLDTLRTTTPTDETKPKQRFRIVYSWPYSTFRRLVRCWLLVELQAGSVERVPDEKSRDMCLTNPAQLNLLTFSSDSRVTTPLPTPTTASLEWTFFCITFVWPLYSSLLPLIFIWLTVLQHKKSIDLGR